MAIVAYAVMRIGKKALKNSVSQIACLVPVFASLCFIEIQFSLKSSERQVID
jgi:hypothetical protein